MGVRLSGQPFSSSLVPEAKKGVWFRDDFLENNTSDSTAIGAGTIAYGGSGSSNAPGIVTLSTAAAISTGYCVHGELNTLRLGGGELVVEWRAKFPSLADATDRFTLRIGLGDAVTTDDFSDGVYFEYDFDTYGNQQWRGGCANNSTRTKLDLGAASAAVADTYQRLKAIVNASATSVQFFVNDVLMGTITTNIPTTRECGYLAQFYKSVGVGVRSVTLDYVDVRQPFTSER